MKQFWMRQRVLSRGEDESYIRYSYSITFVLGYQIFIKYNLLYFLSLFAVNADNLVVRRAARKSK